MGWQYQKDGTSFGRLKTALSVIRVVGLPFSPSQLSVANRIDKIQHDFLRGKVGDEFKLHLVSWSKICTLISSGDLEVRNLILFNQALLEIGGGS